MEGVLGRSNHRHSAEEVGACFAGRVPLRRPSTPYFLTLRLPDALPPSVVAAWHEDIDRRIRRLSDIKGRPLDSAEERQVVNRALGRVDRVLDSGRGNCLLSDARAAGLVESVLWQGDGNRYQLHAWSVMPNHAHALVTPIWPNTSEDVVQEWQSESTRRVNQELWRVGALWHSKVIAHEVDGEAEFARLRCAVSTNPLRAGLAEWPFAGEETRADREYALNWRERQLAAV